MYSSPIVSKFLPGKPHLLAIGDEDGYFHLYNNDKLKMIKKTRLHENSIFDICFKPNDNFKYLTASGDKVIKLWDLNYDDKFVAFEGHYGSVKSVNFCWCDKNIFASGARDGSIRMWDTRYPIKGNFH
ncbi:unnamed protein product [Gordionus sp. m RMFG-2023]